MNIFFTADTHFHHKNIIKYCNRPFTSVEEMDQIVIDNWNSVVKPDDRIYHLGDFAFANQAKMQVLLSQLNGYKVLLKGNHDKNKNVMQRLGFNETYDHLFFDIKGQTVLLSHYPFPESQQRFNLKDDGHIWLLCGHIHDLWKNNGRMLNVGVDVWKFKPVSLDEIETTLTQLNGGIW